jgi:competence protein ComEC
MPEKRDTSFNNYWLPALALLLALITAYIFWLDWQALHRKLTFAMLDIGQGDGLFIESPTGTQVLVDGGPPGAIMKQLPKMMHFFDKSIDAIVITNPDADHIGGFLDVLKTYKIGQVFEPGTFNDSATYKNLENAIKAQGIPDTVVHNGMQLDLGGGVVIDILFPDRDVSTWTTNDGSIVARLSYGATSVMLTGDATSETEKLILAGNSADSLKSTILKVGHHGSRTSTSPEFVQALQPAYALISDGVKNKYGHPHQETLDTLKQFAVQVLRTDLLGTIVMKSDGQNATFSFHK